MQLIQLAANFRTAQADWLSKNPKRVAPAEQEKLFRTHSVSLYLDCQLSVQTQRFRSTADAGPIFQLLLQRKQPSSQYSKDDLWVVSSDDAFAESTTVVMRSTFYGPSASGHVEASQQQCEWCEYK